MPEEKGFEREVLDRLIKIEAKIESWDSSKAQIYENQREILLVKEKLEKQQEDIEQLENRNTWLSRSIATAAISIVVSWITFFIKIGG